MGVSTDTQPQRRTWVSQEESRKGVMGVVGQAGLFLTGEKVF